MRWVQARQYVCLVVLCVSAFDCLATTSDAHIAKCTLLANSIPSCLLRATPVCPDLHPPALAFVKTVCAVLALDSAVEDQVAVLRRNLLKLVHVREYASASEFQVGLLLASPAPYPTGPYPWLMSCVCAFWQHSG